MAVGCNISRFSDGHLQQNFQVSSSGQICKMEFRWNTCRRCGHRVVLYAMYSEICCSYLADRGYHGNNPMKVHKLYLLRAKLLHFVNCLSYYLLTRVREGWEGWRTCYLYSFSSSIIDSSQLRTRVLSANKWGVYNYSVACSLSFTLSLSPSLLPGSRSWCRHSATQWLCVCCS